MKRFYFFGPRVVLEEDYERRKQLSKQRITSLEQEIVRLKAEKAKQEEAYRSLAEELEKARKQIPSRGGRGRFVKRDKAPKQ